MKFLFVAFVITLTTSIPDSRASESKTVSRHACSSSESWSFSRTFQADAADQFQSFLGKRISATRGFSEGIALRKNGKSPDERLFAQYWISRSLLELGDVHGAYAGFAAVAKNRPDRETMGALVASMECLNQIRDRYPSIAVNGPTTEQVDPQLQRYLDLTDRASDLQSVWKFAVTELRQSLVDRSAPTPSLLGLLQGAGIFESFGLGLVASSAGNHKETISYLSKVSSGINANAPGSESLTRYSDQIHLLLARALYSEKRFIEAMNELKRIEKSSNELAEGLSELAWGALMAGKYSDAIGAAINLQAGGLRRTFAPEGPMVMAMALNEICQYPESLHAISVFKNAYEPSYMWLSRWKVGATNEDLYSLALGFLKKKRLSVPERVVSEWVRSPVFIGNQEELNLVVDEKILVKKAGRDAAGDQKRMAQEIRAHGTALRAEVAKQKKGPFPQALRSKLAAFRWEIEHYRNMRRAAAPFRRISMAFDRETPKMRARLTASIQQDFARRNSRMIGILEEIAENDQLIEVEIYNGASSDIIWQNAHSDYKQMAEKMRQEQIKTAANRVWNWGHAPVLSEGWSEIWEDELGSFKSDLYDNCSSKNKYLAIKKLNFNTGSASQAQAAQTGKTEENRK